MLKNAKSGRCFCTMRMPCICVGKVFNGFLPAMYRNVLTTVELTSTENLDVLLGPGWKSISIENRRGVVVFLKIRKSRKGVVGSRKCCIRLVFKPMTATFMQVTISFTFKLLNKNQYESAPQGLKQSTAGTKLCLFLSGSFVYTFCFLSEAPIASYSSRSTGGHRCRSIDEDLRRNMESTSQAPGIAMKRQPGQGLLGLSPNKRGRIHF